ncbi:translocation/assembly module TamB domain-containing protein [Marivivens donghaensis]|uniref:translocation/assembly module TamB domain-containing protein n=1 Tax=Marivivens donghaensis TaxID=1699413 RepID=UPI00201E9599|nr:translocation/assembly module TamB domain-containing protein [Marivivens donghaensis]MCL7407749.1 translocation/assembly module TamB domain-containing protein [Marivivens donghaensis]MDN3704272.1 translocation/assembly module TamB domain-containing protein [Marivivens donghaensis]
MRKFLFLLALALPIPAAAQDTVEADRGLIVDFLTDNLSGAGREVQIYGFQGALSSQAKIDRLTIADADGVWLDAQGLVLDWNRAALLAGRVEVSDLSADSIAMLRKPLTEAQAIDPSASSAPFALPDLPVSLTVDHMSVGALSLGADLIGEPVSLSITGSAALAGGAGSADLRAERIDGQTGELILTGSFSNESRVLGLTLALREGDAGIAARLLDLPGLPSIALSIDGTAPLDAYEATIALDTDGQARLSGMVGFGSVTTAPDSTEKTFQFDLGGDVTALFLPEYRDFFGPDVRLAAAGRSTELGTALSALTIETQSLRLNGSANLDETGWPIDFALTGDMGRADGAPVLLPISGTQTYLRSATLDIGFDATNGDQWNAKIDAQDFVRTGISIPYLTLNGGGTIAPNRSGLTANLTYGATGISLDDEGLTDAMGDEVSGALSLDYVANDRTTLREFSLSGAGIDAQLSAIIDPTGNEIVITPDLSVVVKGLSRFATLAGLPDLAGDAELTAKGTVHPLRTAVDLDVVARTTDLSIGQPQADALLAGDGVLTLRAVRDEAGTRIEGLDFQSSDTALNGTVALTAEGVLGRATLNTPAAGLIDGASGALSVTVNGARATDGTLTAEAVITRDGDRIDLSADLPAEGQGPITLNAEVADLSQYAALAGLDLSGGASVTINGTAQADGQVFDLTANATTRNVAIGNASLDPILAGTGQLATRLRRDDQQITVDPLTLTFPNLTGQATLATDGTTGGAEFNLRLADLALIAPDFSGPLTTKGTATLTENGAWQIDTQADGAAGLSANVAGQIAGSNLDLRINGAAPLALLNGVLEPRRLTGTAGFNLTVSGPAALDAVAGQIQITRAELSAPTLGQSLRDLDGTITLANGSAQVDMTGASSLGGGLALRGRVGLSGGLNSALTVEANNIVVRDPTLYESTLTGAIAINGPLAGGAQISGTIDVAQSEIQVPSSTVGSLGDVPDVTHIGAPSDVRQTLQRAGLTGEAATTTGGGGPAYGLDITINAPARLFVRGRGLDAELGGRLTLQGTTQQIIPAGQFDLIRGRLDILQQRFALTDGAITMQGDFIPKIRFVATTESLNGTTVNVIVEGPASAPEVSFTSAPELPQDEVLSQLLFGRDMSSISAFQAVQLAAAVGTLTGRSGGGLIDKIRQGSGLDDLDVTTDDAGNAALSAGKYLSDNIYTDVTVSSQGDTEINLNLDLGGDFTAKGGFGTTGDTSVGVFFEKDY